jgi:Ca-activated chloride channel family protein
MKFGAPIWLSLLPVLGLGLLLFRWWAARRAERALAARFATPLLPHLLRSVGRARRIGKLALLVIGALALGLALARPQWGRREIEIERTGVDLVFALDVSRSMLAADAVGTNRLSVAREAIERLVAELGGDRAGLVVFAGEAMTAAPLTRDHTALLRALVSARPGTVSAAGSNLGEAIQQARRCFDRAATGPRALLILSDGEQLQGDAVEAARAAHAAGLQVHAAGVGSAAGAKVPAPNWGTGGSVRNPLGREVVSRRDEQQLQRIATAGGGIYVRLEPGDTDALTAWFRQAAAGLPHSTEKRTINEPRERFQWPLAGALALLGAEWALSDRRRSRRDGRGPVRATQRSESETRS